MTKKITPKDVESYKTLLPLLTAMFTEIKALSSKKPDAVVSTGKVAMVNRLLEKLKELLKAEGTIDYLDLLDNETLPQMSDVTLILSQYVAAMEQFESNHQRYNQATFQNEWIV